MENEVKITFNSGRLGLVLAIFLFFFALGLLFLIKADSLATIWIIKKIVIRTVGALTSITSACFILLFFKIFFRKVALVLDSDGIVDTSSGLGASGRVTWSQITNISNAGTAVLVFIEKPEDFIHSKKNKFNRYSLKMNYRNYGTPIVIQMFALNSYVDTLERQLRERWAYYKQKIANEE